MPAKKAVLIGCNYPGTNAELKGCVNDVLSMQEMLTKYYGFTPTDITVMIDTDPKSTQPTGRNIKAVLTAMVQQARDGDVLLVHYSGHGTQVPTSDPKETDGKDEAICPCDMNVMTDDDLRSIFLPLKNKKDVKLTFVADCCHSGTLLDHEEVVITGPKPGGPPPPAIDTAAIQSMLAALGGGKKEMDGDLLRNRALPYSDLCGFVVGLLGKLLSKDHGQKAGGEGAAPLGGGLANLASLAGLVSTFLANSNSNNAGGGASGSKPLLSQTDFHKVMNTLFGDSASAGSKNNSQMMTLLSMGASMLMGGAGAGGAAGAGTGAGAGGILASLMSMCFSGNPGAVDQAGQQYNSVPASEQQVPPPPVGQQSDQELPTDVGILITGCQDKETSADARPPGGKAHGALTNALVTVVKGHHDSGVTYPLSYRNLVIGVRESLAKTGFTQNPCLECGLKWADSNFITHQ